MNSRLSLLLNNCRTISRPIGLRVGLWVASFALLAISTRPADGCFADQHSSRRAPANRIAQLPDNITDRTPSPLDPVKAKVINTNLHAFGIPFGFNEDRDSFIEVQLYISKDQGKSWSFYDRATPDKTEFPFTSDQDGEYWFAVKTLDHDRRLFPSGSPQPELKIRIDRIKPKLEFRVDADLAGRVICNWRATDQNLLPKSLKIYYQPIASDGSLKAWNKVPVKLQGQAIAGIYSDQIGWWPETSESALNIAVEIRDAAGNITRADRKVRLPATGWRNRKVATARPQAAGGAAQAVQRPSYNQRQTKPQPDWAEPNWKSPQANGPPQGLPRTASNSQVNVPLMLPGEEQVDPPVPPGYTPNDELDRVAAVPKVEPMQSHGQPNRQVWQSDPSASRLDQQQSISSTSTRIDPTIVPLPVMKPKQPATFVPSNPATTQFEGDQVISQSSTMTPNNQYRGIPAKPRTDARPELLPNQDPGHQRPWTTDSPSSNAGSFSQASFANQNRQQNQRPVLGPISAKPNRSTNATVTFIGTHRFRLPYGIDAIDPSGVGRVDLWITSDDGKTWKNWGTDPDHQSPFPVEIQQDGRYGFRVTVHSRDGLSGLGPSSGSDADIWINVDTKAPLTMIKSVPYGRGNEVGKLVINYRANDNFLTLRPITLLYAKNPQGPWQQIESGLRNEGRYVWSLNPDQVPDQVFLKIEARDRAGNVGSHVLSQSIDVTGLKPRATIHGVTPVGK